MDKIESKKFPSSIDVAKLAGVSQSAVSRTFTRNGSVSEATRSKVVAAAEKLGYQPSAIPRIMLTHRSYLVAVAIGGMYNPFNSSILEQFTRRLQELGYQMILVHVEDGETLEVAMPKLASYRVDAIFIARGVLDSATAQVLSAYRIPIIAFHTPVANDWVFSVVTDNAAAGRMIADHFHERGGRRYAFVGGPRESTDDRLGGFRRRLKKLGAPPPVVMASGFTYEGGREAASVLFTSDEPPDAVFCGNDLVAIGCMDVARQLGRRVPEDIMIAGFDDIPEAGWSGNSLTTFGQREPNMVDASIQLLQDITKSDAPVSVRSVVKVRLIERGSTARRR